MNDPAPPAHAPAPVDHVLQYLLEGMGALFGERFLEGMVLYLSRTFAVRFCFLGEYDPAGQTVTTRAMAVDGMLAPVMTYTLAGTPCAEVLEQGIVCAHPEGVIDQFASDHLLVEMGIQSYYGLPLRNAEENLNGLLVLMHDRPRRLGEEDVQRLRLFALRAGAEMARMRFETDNARLLAREQAARAEAEAALSVRDVFVSVASHELKTPLAALQLQIDGLLRAARGESAVELSKERLVGALEHAQSLGRRFGRLIDDLLDVSQISATGALVLNREDVDLVAIIEDAIDSLSEPLARAGCDVTWTAVEHVRGSWDRFRIYQCAANLLANAMKYGRGKPIELAVTRSGDGARFTVRDHGVGIDVGDQERIFERFERAHENHYGGLGLGLFIVRRILRTHGGAIRVESVPGEGSLFIVDLPCAASSGDAA